MSKKKIDLLVEDLIMPLPWVKDMPKQIPIAKIPQQKIVPPTQPKVEKTAPVVETPPTKKETPPEPKKIKLTGIGAGKIKTGGFSIKKTLEKNEQQNEEIINTAKDAFTLDDLMPLWQTQAELAKKEGKKSYHASLTKNQPILKENFVIELIVNNRVQEETVHKEKPALLEFLKEKLNNYSIQINTIVVEQEKEVHLYTDKDKFTELLKKNPDLLYLKEKFNLDFEF